MLIRSQDRRHTTTNLNLDIYSFIEGSHKIGNADVNILGEYSTEEKAIKVLDKIQEMYARCESVRVLTSGISVSLSALSKETGEEYRDMHRETFVFQMPQDEEVE